MTSHHQETKSLKLETIQVQAAMSAHFSRGNTFSVGGDYCKVVKLSWFPVEALSGAKDKE